MIVERALNEQYLANSFVVGDEPGGNAVIIDAGGPAAPLVEAIGKASLTVTHLLCTHHHADHVACNDFFKSEYGCPIFVPAAEADLFQGPYDQTIVGGDVITSGGLTIQALHTPGHTKGMLAFVVATGEAGAALREGRGFDEVGGDSGVFSGDTLFKGTVGGTLAPGHATFADLRASIMDTLMGLPHEIAAYPGHTDFTTIGAEWEANPFIRIWRGLDEPDISRCMAMGRPADLVLRARDYDGGTKCWVRFDDGGDEIAPGSRVVDAT
jgi:glyoxylase-like metal-dependent hydrolase (beta-lactamase superfamily II)